jgi:NadR type nicotinamide-nucleotide adenylyltransferase
LARQLGARYVAVDKERQAVPVSSTEIRSDPLASWRFLPPCVRAHYALRVHVVGAEQTGKTTLVRHLAQHYRTAGTTEYARTLYPTGNGWQATDTQVIARAQVAQEAALARQCNRVLFCDTDLLSVELWSERLFGGAPSWVGEKAARPGDLYLLMDTDGPATGADFPEDRQRLQQRLAEELVARNLPYRRLSGTWKEREAAAIQAVDTLLRSKSEAGGA